MHIRTYSSFLYYSLYLPNNQFKVLWFRSKKLESLRRAYGTKPALILGIESSCDDTGIAIVDTLGNILSEQIHSQHLTHLKFGGIIPTIARDLHKSNITKVCEDVLRNANLKLRDLDAIAVTVKPGLPLSLLIGNKFAKYLSQLGNKPLIPIHHMQAHALTIRIVEKVEFPYLTLLISGGHCLLAIVQDVDRFYLLGHHIDNSPGEVLDKLARQLKMKNLPEYKHLSGGQAIELAASRATNPKQYDFPSYLTSYNDCQFSFSGLYHTAMNYISKQEKDYNISADQIIPDLDNICAGIQIAVVKHVCHRTQRAMHFSELNNLVPKGNPTLAISGGVACNNFLAKAMNIICSKLEWKFVRTPPKLCTDNGVMIAWNGVERWNSNIGILHNKDEIENLKVEKNSPLGEDWTGKVKDASLKIKKVQIMKHLLNENV